VNGSGSEVLFRHGVAVGVCVGTGVCVATVFSWQSIGERSLSDRGVVEGVGLFSRLGGVAERIPGGGVVSPLRM
jgi:hypothetical protein